MSHLLSVGFPTILYPRIGARQTLAPRVPVPTGAIQRAFVPEVALTPGIYTDNNCTRTRSIG